MSNFKHNRRSIRLKNYDYSQAGAYFITICTQDRECLFGEIIDDKMILNDAGEIIQEFHAVTESHFNDIHIFPFIIMPNHYHAIITVGAGFPRPCVENDFGQNNTGHNDIGRGNPAPTLGNIVGYFKYQTSKQINIMRGTPGQILWQRNYYEHIIRNEDDHSRICEYIDNNPLKWKMDSLHPENVGV